MTLDIAGLVQEREGGDLVAPRGQLVPLLPAGHAALPEIVCGSSVDGLVVVGEASRALEALPRVRPEIMGGVKLCYLDPPYNTGERFAYYDDRRDSDAWLNDFKSHLEGLRPLLASDASVWVHLDDSEQHRARVVLDEVFGREAFVGTIIWQKRLTRDSRKAFSSMHDYIHVYAPAGPKAWKRVRNGLSDGGAFANPDGDPRGPWRSAPMTVQAGHATPSQFYTVVTPTGAKHEPPAGRCWTYTEARLKELVAEGRVYWPRGGDGKPRLKRYQSESGGLAPFTIWGASEVGDTASAKKSLLREFPSMAAFDTPKPIELLERIVGIATDPGDLVLDYYLGSGTTAVASQRLGRSWVGVERNADVVERFVVPRLVSAYRANPAGGIGLSRLG
ncbi:site-specific DNA-methyltransferase [Microbacterium sp. M]|uniref:site-specific DNA-methyltransferase n=1 Tax=Microbacterium sp. M TaxID=3377125 RepID=UPI00386A3A6C